MAKSEAGGMTETSRDLPARRHRAVFAGHHAGRDERAPVQDVDEALDGHGLALEQGRRIYVRMPLETDSRRAIKRLKSEGWTFRSAKGVPPPVREGQVAGDGRGPAQGHVDRHGASHRTNRGLALRAATGTIGRRGH